MINIAIDGPSGAGKSTVARAVSASLGYIYIDTGAMYRSLAYKAVSLGIDISSDTDAVVNMLGSTELRIVYEDGVQHMLVDGEDISERIRTPQISLASSAVAAIPEVRSWLLELQRSMARENNCIMDGRDIGTSVLPDAEVKIFLTASAEARAKRRCDELVAKGEDVSYDDVLKDIVKRDENDSNRKCSPLKKADGAILVDTSDMSFDEVVSAIKNIAERVGSKDE